MRRTFHLFFICFLFTISLQAQWTKTNGLPGGNTYRLVNYGDTVLATIGSQLFFSSNHGKTWSPIVNPAFEDINPLSVDRENVLGYAYDRTQQKYIWVKSDDFFQTLQPVTIPDSLSFSEIFLAFGHIYLTTSQGTLRTNDNGATWAKITPSSPYHVTFDGQRITGIRSTYIVQSDDEGFTWDTLLHFSAYAPEILQHENFIFLFGGYATQGCYSSADYGQTWQHFTGTAFVEYYKFVRHNGNIFGLGGDKLIRSSNNGASWEAIQLPSSTAGPAYYAVSSGNALIIGGIQSEGSAGMHRSTDDGNSWTPVSSGIAISSGRFRQIGPDFFVASPDGVYQNNADGINWTKLNISLPQAPHAYWTDADFVKSGNNWLLSDGQTAWVSIDGGNFWSKSVLPNPNVWDPYLGITDFHMLKNRIIAGGFGSEYYQHYISYDNGLSFNSLQSLYLQYQTYIISLYVFGTRVYALANDKKIYYTDDGCDTWLLHSEPHPLDSLFWCGLDEHALLISGNVQVVSTAYYCNDNKMLFSKDDGQTWTYYDLNTAGFPWGTGTFNDLLRVGNYLVAATQNGIYLSENDGTDWMDWNNGLLYNNITDIAVRNGYLWASAEGGGIWKRPLSQLAMGPAPDRFLGDSNPLHHPIDFSPNPASSQVRVETQGQAGELMLQDATGRVVLRKSTDGTEAEFSVERLPAGLYQVVLVGEKTTLHGSLVVEH